MTIEDSLIKLRVKRNKNTSQPTPNPFDLALKASKYAKTTFKEFEKESEKLQDKLFTRTS